MELTQLNYFRTLARVGNMTQAAEDLHITQPALSRSIAALERDLDVALFTRDKGKLCLNRAGELFLETADKVYIEVQNGLSRVNALSDESYENIRYGITHHGMISAGLAAFLQQTPGAHIFEELVPVSFAIDRPKVKLESCEVDFFIAQYPIRSPIVDAHKLYTDRFILMTYRDDPLSENGYVDESEVSNLSLIMTKNHCRFDALYEGPNFSYQIFYEGGDLSFGLSLVKDKLGCMIVPQMEYSWMCCSGLFHPDEFTVLPIIKNGQPVTFDVYLSQVKGRLLPRMGKQLVSHLVDFYSEHQ